MFGICFPRNDGGVFGVVKQRFGANIPIGFGEFFAFKGVFGIGGIALRVGEFHGGDRFVLIHRNEPIGNTVGSFGTHSSGNGQ